MQINKIVKSQTLTIELIGRLDAVTSLELDEALKNSLEDIEELDFEMSKLDYIASAGLRILLKYQKMIDKSKKKMTLKNLKPEVREVLDMTGFSDFLNIIDINPVKKLSIEF